MSPARVPVRAPFRALAGLGLTVLVGCTSLPDTGRDAARLGPVPPLAPLDALLAAPPPEATPELAQALAERGAALRAEAAAMD